MRRRSATAIDVGLQLVQQSGGRAPGIMRSALALVSAREVHFANCTSSLFDQKIVCDLCVVPLFDAWCRAPDTSLLIFGAIWCRVAVSVVMSASRFRRLLDREHEFQVWDMRCVQDMFQDLECEASEAVLRAPLVRASMSTTTSRVCGRCTELRQANFSSGPRSHGRFADDAVDVSYTPTWRHPITCCHFRQ